MGSDAVLPCRWIWRAFRRNVFAIFRAGVQTLVTTRCLSQQFSFSHVCENLKSPIILYLILCFESSLIIFVRKLNNLHCIGEWASKVRTFLPWRWMVCDSAKKKTARPVLGLATTYLDKLASRNFPESNRVLASEPGHPRVATGKELEDCLVGCPCCKKFHFTRNIW